MSVPSKLAWMKELRGADLTHAEFRVLLTVASYTDAHGRNAYPGQDRIAADAVVRPNTARDALKSLIAKGWLTVADSTGGKYGRGRAAVYELSTPTLKGSVTDPLSETVKGSVSDRKGVGERQKKGSVSDPPSDQVSDQVSDPANPLPGFEEFQNNYPKPKPGNQRPVEQAYRTALTFVRHDELLGALARFSSTVEDKNSEKWKFCVGPVRWLTEKHWEQYPPTLWDLPTPTPDPDYVPPTAPYGWGSEVHT